MLKYIELKFRTIPRNIDSIKLFGSIVYAYSDLYGDVEQFVKKFEENKILISSLFPKNKETFFFPKPILSINHRTNFESKEEKIEYIKKIKKLKKVKCISKNLLEKVLEKGYVDEIVEEILKEKEFDFKIVPIPKVSISRLTGTSKIYYEEVYSPSDFTMFFLIKFGKEEDFKIILSCLKYLKDRGIGMNLSTGFGKFEIIKYGEFSFSNSNKDMKYLLSKVCMDEKDSLDNNSCYDLTEIKGFSRAGNYIQPHLFFVEGSCITGNLKGKIIRVGEKTLIYGKPLFF